MNTICLSLCAVTTVLAATLPVQAAILNSGFETGDFTNWSTGGDVAVQTNIFGDSSALIPEGTYVALLSNATVVGGTALDANTLESSAGLPSGSLTSRGASNGSFIAQTFSANAGDILSFRWNFFTNEFTNLGVTTNDFAFFSIIPSVETLADVNTGAFMTAAAASIFSATTGFQSVTQVLPTNGTYRFVSGVVNAGDVQAESGLAIDLISTTKSTVPTPGPVPVPGPEISPVLSFVTLGAWGAMAQLKRRGQKRKALKVASTLND